MKKNIVLITIGVMFLSVLLFYKQNNNTYQSIERLTKKGNTIAFMIEQDDGTYKNEEDLPTSMVGYEFNQSKSTCTNGATPSWDSKTNSLRLSLTSKNTSCYLFFGKSQSLKKVEELGLGTPKGDLGESVTGPSCASGTNDSSHSSGDCTLQENGLYAAEDDYGTSYIYRGTVNNNWVKFGQTKDNKDIWWRIIRINGNGTIRLIYSGAGTKEEVADANGYWSKATTSTSSSVSQIGTQAYNTSKDDNAYVGFMYGDTGQSDYNKTHTNTNKSDIMKYLENWYNGTEDFSNNGFNSLNSKAKIDGSTGFCNDREVVTGHGTFAGNGTGTEKSGYAPTGRVWESTSTSYDKSSQEPTLKCANKIRDLFTMSGNEQGKGNGALSVPIGLITSDEVIYSGGFTGQKSYGCWLYTGASYWTMSPFDFDSGANIFIMDGINGYLGYTTVGWTAPGVRPVINLKADTVFVEGGNGTTEKPFVVQEVTE